MRVEQLTFTRFIAAVAIVIYHYGLSTLPFGMNAIHFIFNEAHLGVSYFFILSGFVMIIAYGQKDKINIFQYLKNRLARIYPVYLLGVLLSALFYVLTEQFDFLNMMLNIFLIQSWIPYKPIVFNPPAWSLSVEMLFYVVFPVVYNKYYCRWSFKKLLLLIIIFWVASQVIFHLLLQYGSVETGTFIHYTPLLHLNQFLLGNLAGIYFIKNLRET